MSAATATISFRLNGKLVTVPDAKPTDLLIDYLRSGSVNLTGTKLSCGEGGCGACTVLWSYYDFDQKKLVEVPVNSCLRPLCSLDGTAITTIEGIAAPNKPDLVQKNMVTSCASQCGYCSPGFVMTMHGLLKKDNLPTPQAIEDQFAGNICRCTGFISILKAMQQTGNDLQAGATLQAQPTPYAASAAPYRQFLITEGDYSYYRPTTIDEVLGLLVAYSPVPGRVKLLQGNTSIGIYKKAVEDPHILVDISRLPHWRVIAQETGSLMLAGGVTIAQLLDYLDEGALSNSLTPALRALHAHLPLIAGVQVRSAASVAGSLMLVKNHQQEGTGMPFPGDLFTVLSLLEASVSYRVPDESDELLHPLLTFPLPTTFPLGFLITAIHIPIGSPEQVVRTYRVARRTQNSHPILNAGFSCVLNDDKTVSAIRLVYGGLGRSAVLMTKTQEAVLAHPQLAWGPALMDILLPVLEAEIKDSIYVAEDAIFPAPYLQSLAYNLFYKFYVYVCQQKDISLPAEQWSATDAPPRPLAQGTHQYVVAPYYDKDTGDLNELVHLQEPAPVQPQPGTYQASNFKMVALAVPELGSLPEPLLAKAPPAAESVQKALTFVQNQSPIKIDAWSQVNGTAKYTHDLTHSADTLQAFYVYSQHRNASFSYDGGVEMVRRALEEQYPGASYICADSIPVPQSRVDNYDETMPGLYDPIFAQDVVVCFGMPIGIVVAPTLDAARAGAEYVEAAIRYYDFSAADTVATLDEAIAKHSLLATATPASRIQFITRPVPEQDPQRQQKTTWLDAPQQEEGKVFVQGSQATGAQAHFYMEPQGTLAIPREDNQLEMYCSTQNQSSVQKRVAGLLGQPMHNIRVGVTRLGGGFGGKELRQTYVACAAAVAAWVLQKPVRLLLDRNTDMRMVGTRHPFQGDYAVSASPTGTIEKMRINYRSDAGISYDCSFPVMDLALLCAENAYYVDTFKTTGQVFRTNIQSRTAFRSFGLVQSMLITETALEHLAFQLNMRPDHLREQNFYKDAQSDNPVLQKTPYGSPLPYCRINQVWRDFGSKIDFEGRLQRVTTFNQQNRWRKRGLAMIPLKYGISYTYRPMNQGSAYVLAYKEDGSVMLNHGGIEMGQGMHTKMAQIAADELGLDIDMIRIATTNTAVIPNVSSTGASTGSDLNGYAVRRACMELKTVLTDFLEELRADSTHVKFPDITTVTTEQIDNYLAHMGGANWPKIISLASIARISVSAQYSYASPSLGAVGPQYGPADSTTPINYQVAPCDSQVFYYYTYCVAASEVEIDVLTGQFEILRADIVYDAGDSLNNNIDYGQVEGGFIQGVGCLTTEEMLYGEQGQVLTDGTWEYKPPCSKTIPQEFNVYLLKYESSGIKTDPPKDSYGIHSSKSTGEPPLVLANSVFFAIRQAVHEARKDAGEADWFDFTAPATVQKIQQACAVGQPQ